MSKAILLAITTAALALPTAAFADTHDTSGDKSSSDKSSSASEKASKDKHEVSAKTTKKGKEEKHDISITTNTERGHVEPATDIGSLSTKNRRDYIANPTGFSAGGMIGGGTAGGYGFGLGAKAGYTLTNRIYLGGMFDYHFGTSESFANNTIRNQTWYFGPEAGYDIGVGPVLLRPVVGLGLMFHNGSLSGTEVASIPGAEQSTTATRVYVAPGVGAVYPIGNFFVGGDARYMITTDNNSLTLFGTGGFHL